MHLEFSGADPTLLSEKHKSYYFIEQISSYFRAQFGP